MSTTNPAAAPAMGFKRDNWTGVIEPETLEKILSNSYISDPAKANAAMRQRKSSFKSVVHDFALHSTLTHHAANPNTEEALVQTAGVIVLMRSPNGNYDKVVIGPLCNNEELDKIVQTIIMPLWEAHENIQQTAAKQAKQERLPTVFVKSSGGAAVKPQQQQHQPPSTQKRSLLRSFITEIVKTDGKNRRARMHSLPFSVTAGLNE